MTAGAREIVERLLRGPTTDDHETAVAMHAAADFIKSLAAENERLSCLARTHLLNRIQLEARVAELELERDEATEANVRWCNQYAEARVRVAELEAEGFTLREVEVACRRTHREMEDVTETGLVAIVCDHLRSMRNAADEAAAKEPRDE